MPCVVIMTLDKQSGELEADKWGSQLWHQKKNSGPNNVIFQMNNTRECSQRGVTHKSKTQSSPNFKTAETSYSLCLI